MNRHECGMTREECDIELCMHLSEDKKYLFGTAVQAMAFKLMMIMNADASAMIVSFIDLAVDDDNV